MKKLLVVIIIIAVVWFLHRTNPTFDDHKNAISPNTSRESSLWEDLQYKDYYLISFTQSVSKKSMVTYGLCRYVKVSDERWSPWGQ